ncbi:MAG TPA: LysM peptidoglycan-binding domain-containing protein [Cellulomonadaceae bacterium]|nr:LysM peptidoglycan-binding domain-containing protein [Cellulomonadaceae bacterium]
MTSPTSATATAGPGLPTRARTRLASGAGVSIALAVASVATSATAAHADEPYVVRQGDTVSQIALRSGVSVGAIARASALADAARIRVGQVLTIPTPSSATIAPVAPLVASTTTHPVVGGDTVSHLAARYSTTVAAIVAANGLDARAFIRIGQVLTIPTTATTTAPAMAAPTPATTTTHTVVGGDTVSHLAARYSTTAAAIVAANGLDARAFIRIGQVLTIPTTATTTAALVSNTFAGRTYSDAVVAAANANKATLLRIGVPTTSQMRATIVTTATSMGVDPALALAIAYQESGFNHTAVSAANAIGTMQVIPSSGEWASQMVGRPLNLLDPNDNVVAGVAILRSLVRTSPDLATAIAGYYQGAASVQRDGMYPDTRRYVASVQTLMSRFR